MAATQASSSVAARGTIQIFVGRMFFLGTGYVITVVLARGLGPADYGIYGLIISLLVWLEGSAGLGVPQATMMLIPGSEKPEAVAQSARVLLVGASLALFAACWLLAPWAADFFSVANGAVLFRVAIADLPFYGLFLAYQGTLQGHERFGSIAVTLIIYGATKLLGTIALVFLGFSVLAALIVNVLATVAALFFLVGRDPPSLLVPDRDLVYRTLAVALPIAIFDFTFQLIYSAHLWLLKRVGETPDEVIGYYAAALNIARLPTLVATVLSGILLSSIARALASNDKGLAHRYVQSASRFVFVVLVPVCVFGAMQAEEIMLLVYSDAYAGSAEFFRPLLLGSGMLALLLTMLNCLIAANRQYLAAGLLIAMLPLLLALGVAMIHGMGPVGAADSFLLATTCGAFAGLVLVAKEFGSPARAGMVLRVAAATLGVALVGQYLHIGGIWVLIVLGVLQCAYWVLLVLMRELRTEDLRPFAVWKTS